MSTPANSPHAAADYTARQSRVVAGLMAAVGLGAGVAVAVMVDEGAPRLLIAIVGVVGLALVVGGLRAVAAPRTELAVDAQGVRVDGRPLVPWAWVRGVAVEPDGEGDDQVVLYVDDAWWRDVNGAWARWGTKLHDDAGNRGFVLPSTSLRSRVEEMADAIDHGLRAYGEPTWPGADPTGDDASGA